MAKRLIRMSRSPCFLMTESSRTNLNMKELIKLDGSGITTTTTDKGVTKIAFQKASDFKDEYLRKFPDSSAKERKLAFERYVREQSTAVAQALDMSKMISLIEQGKLGVKRVSVNKKQTEMTTVFIDLSATAKAGEVKAQADSLSEADARELIEYLQKKLAKDVNSASVDFQNLLAQ